MNTLKCFTTITCTLLLFLFLIVSVKANDSAVETAVGGLILRKEHSVLMQKERLQIEENKILVEYEFINTSDSTIVSEVAFPIPEFKNDILRGSIDFGDFKTWVDDTQIMLKKEVKAFVGDHDVTADLLNFGITIESFGYYSDQEGVDINKYEVLKLPLDVRRKLVKLGAVGKPHGIYKESEWHYPPKWWVQLKYHWTQEFPPGKMVRVKHEYKPVIGFEPVNLEDILNMKNELCIDSATLEIIKTMSEYSRWMDFSGGGYFHISWVSYILTTANSWKTPISDFELIVSGRKDNIITFCWDEPLDRSKDNHVIARKSHFIPKKDLNIYYIWIH